MKKNHALRANRNKAKQSQFEPKPMLKRANFYEIKEFDRPAKRMPAARGCLVTILEFSCSAL